MAEPNRKAREEMEAAMEQSQWPMMGSKGIYREDLQEGDKEVKYGNKLKEHNEELEGERAQWLKTGLQGLFHCQNMAYARPAFSDEQRPLHELPRYGPPPSIGGH